MQYASAENINGESSSTINVTARTKLLNEPMTYLEMEAFYKHTKTLFPKLPELLIRNMNKSNARLYGTFFERRNEIRINRSCVHTFIHELAHAVQRYVHNDRGYSHSGVFVQTLDFLICQWLKANPDKQLELGIRIVQKGEN